MKLGFIGLGKMGSRMVLKLLKEKHEVVVWNRSNAPIKELKSQITNLKPTYQNLKTSRTTEELITKLPKPRIIWSMVPAGGATESILNEVSKFIEKEDIVIDGGNSYYKDTERRYEDFKKKKIRFLGIGISGGIIAEKTGYPMMAGGDKKAYEFIKPILDSLAKPNGGYDYFGEGGAGHFVKMVHNAIEYGIMQSIGEGFGLLNNSQYNFDLQRVAKIYQRETLISGFMMERTMEVLGKDSKLSKIEGVIGKASSETIWAVEYARKNNLPVEIIKRSLEIRNESEKDIKIQNSFAARMVSALRNAFGGHEVKKKGNMLYSD